MTQNIYIDVYFGFNFLMDFIVLLIMGILINNKKSIVRITLSAIIASTYATIILILNAGGVFVMLLTYFVVAIIMLLIAFGKTDIKNGIKNLLTLYFVTFVINGTVNAFYYGSGTSGSILERSMSGTFGEIHISFIFCVLIIAVTMVVGVTNMMKKRIKMSRSLFSVIITVHTKKIKVMALCDTGNSLREPITGKPVSVVEKECLKILENEELRYVVVPYHSVGKSGGLMNGFISDCMEVNGKIIENAMIGIYEGNLSRENNYQMLLHPDMMNEKEI